MSVVADSGEVDFDPRAGSAWRSIVFALPAGLFAFGFAAMAATLIRIFPGYIRPRAGTLIRTWGRVMRFFFAIRLEVHGREHLAAAGPQIVLFNHQSLLDLFLVSSLWPDNGTVLYKREFHKVPIIGSTMRRFGFIPVDRANREAAIGSIGASGDRIREQAAKVLVAPEGTRSRRGGLQRFKMGPFHLAAETGAPIVPTIYRGVWELMPMGRWRIRSGTVRVDILPPIDTSDWGTQGVRSHAEAIHALYRRYLPEAPLVPDPRARDASDGTAAESSRG